MPTRINCRAFPTLLTFLILLSLQCKAQQPIVERMTETNEAIPVDDQRRDGNKQLCALIKVKVGYEVTDVEGNVMGDIIHHGNEMWVYMAQGSRNMKIHLKNNLPVRVIFRDYDIDGLKSNRIYELIINAPQSGTDVSSEGNPRKNSLQMRISPSYAKITIWSDGKTAEVFHPDSIGSIKVQLPYGRYYYRAEVDGYETVESSLFVNDEDTWHLLALKVKLHEKNQFAIKNLRVVLLDKKEKPTDLIKKARQLEISFDADTTRHIMTGPMDIFIRIVGPDNNLLFKRGTFEYQDYIVDYSIKSSSIISPGRQIARIKIQWNIDRDLMPGRYLIDLYESSQGQRVRHLGKKAAIFKPKN